ncbi:FAD-binding oxidoreductase [Lactobacillaceae bacterium Melli_B4]
MSIFKAFSNSNIINELKQQAPHATIESDAADLAKHQNDQDGIVNTNDQLIAYVEAGDKEDVKGALAVARKYHLPVIPQSSATSLVSGSNAIQNGIMLSTGKMNQIIKLDAEDQLAVVQPGVINKHLDDEAHQIGMLFAPDPGSRTFASVGGNTNTNAGGAQAVRFGTTRDSVLGMTVILADGRELHLGGKTYKNSFGYDLTHLFVGAEGTLGIVTEITFKLFPIPLGKTIGGAALFNSNEQAVKAAAAIQKSGAYPSLLRLIDKNILINMDKMNGTNYADSGDALLVIQITGSNDQVFQKVKDIFTQFNGQQVQLSDDENTANQIAGLAGAMYPAIYSNKGNQFFTSDLTVPLSKTATLIDYADQLGKDASVAIFTASYTGDGTVHPTVAWPKDATSIPDNVIEVIEKLYQKTIELDGTITGEYSVGELKKQWVNRQLGADVDYVQQQIKSVLDPMHLLNPKRKID